LRTGSPSVDNEVQIGGPQRWLSRTR
jgi:hypothetical protein